MGFSQIHIQRKQSSFNNTRMYHIGLRGLCVFVTEKSATIFNILAGVGESKILYRKTSGGPNNKNKGMKRGQ